MVVKTESGMQMKVPSQGQANYNTVAGSAGLLSFLGLNLGNVLGGCGNRWGGNRCGNDCGCGDEMVNRYELGLTMMCDQKQALIDSLQTELKTNEKITTATLTINDKLQALATVVADLAAKQAVTNQRVDDNLVLVTTDLNSKIALEAERRACADNNLQAWTANQLAWKVNYAQYVDGSQVFCPQNNICGVVGAVNTAGATAASAVPCTNCTGKKAA